MRSDAPRGVRKVSDWVDLKNALDRATLVVSRELPLEARKFNDKVFGVLAVIGMPQNFGVELPRPP